MNPVVRLIAALGLGLAWYLVTRFLGPQSKASKEDPAGNLRRNEVVGAIRSLAFFFLVWFITTTLVIFVFGLAIALLDPPNSRGFVDAFSDVINSASGSSGPLNPLSLWGALAGLVATVGAVWLAQRVARGGQSLLDLGFRPYKELPFDLVLGLVLGPLLFAVIFQLESLLGYLVGNSGPGYNWGQLGTWTIVFLCVAISEEIVVRGYLLQLINQVWGGAAAVVITSVFWGFAHLLNPKANLLGVFNIMVIGLVFAYAYNITGRLWLPIALHFSWNMAEGPLFGFPVSGFQINDAVFQPLVNGPLEMTGGLFGPEGGVVSLIAITLGGLILYGWERTRRPSEPQKP